MNENNTHIVSTVEVAEYSPHSHHGPFYLQAEFWVAVSFILVVAALSKSVSKLFKALMRKRIEGIKNRIHDAANLKKDAQELLAEYEKKYNNANSEARMILARAENETELVKKETLAKLERDMRNKEKEAENRIIASEHKAETEIISLAGSLTINALKLAIQNKLDEKNKDRMIDESIGLIAKL